MYCHCCVYFCRHSRYITSGASCHIAHCFSLIIESTVQKEFETLILWCISYYSAQLFSLYIATSHVIDDFRGACAVKGNVQVAGHVKHVNHGDAFNAFALCTNPPLAAMISGCLVVVPILGSGMKLLVPFY